MAKYKIYTVRSTAGRKILVIKAKKLKELKTPDGVGFRPICEHGVEI